MWLLSLATRKVSSTLTTLHSMDQQALRQRPWLSPIRPQVPQITTGCIQHLQRLSNQCPGSVSKPKWGLSTWRSSNDTISKIQIGQDKKLKILPLNSAFPTKRSTSGTGSARKKNWPLKRQLAMPKMLSHLAKNSEEGKLTIKLLLSYRQVYLNSF